MDSYINNKSWTICAWVNTTSSDTIIISLSYGLRLFVGNTSFISLYNSSRTVNANFGGATINDGLWHHVAVTYNTLTNEIITYADGINTEVTLYTSGYTYSSSWNNGLFVGKDPNNLTVNDHYLFKGKLNDVRIYDECVSEKQIKEISKGLVVHYKFDDSYIEDTTNMLSNKTISFGPLTIQMTYINNNGAYTIKTTDFMSGYSYGTLRMTLPLDVLLPNLIQSISFKIKNILGNSDFNLYDWCDSGTHTIKAYNCGEFLLCKGTITRSNYDSVYHFLDFNSIDRNSEFIIYDILLENKDHPTPFTPSIRNSGKVFDCSGFHNDGSINGSVVLTNYNSPRYSICTTIPAATTITHPRAVAGDDTLEWTCCAWVYMIDYNGYIDLNSFNNGNRLCHGSSPLLYLNDGSYDYYTYGQALEKNKWTHIAFVFRNSDHLRRIYRDGINISTSGPLSSHPRGILDTVTLLSNFNGYISDYREYATALSEDDIKELYEVTLSIDKNGNIYSYSFIEN